MEKDQLGFSCPHCGIDLTVPLAASGVEGPCPRCGSVIRAPKIVEPEAAPEPVRLEVSAANDRFPRSRPTFQSAPVSETVQPGGGKAAGNARAWVLAVVGFAGVIGLAAVLYVIQALRQLPDARDMAIDPAPMKTPAARKEAPRPELPPELDPKVPPEGMDVTALVTKSAEILGKFLKASTLAERRQLIEGRTPQEELAGSVLASGWSFSPSFKSSEVRFNKVERASDVIFIVPMSRDAGALEMHMVVVRTRGSQDPRVLIDPLLDGFGGRLSRFAAKPVAGERTFRVVMTVFDFCTDESVPGHQDKFTMKISSHPGGADLMKCYFSGHSPLAEKFPKSLLPHGQSVAATVVLRWNLEDRPFIEAIDIKSLDWDD